VKVPLSWLREFVQIPPDWSAQDLAHRLTQAGFEVEGIHPAAEAFRGVVVAKILTAMPHPDAKKLQVCQVLASDEEGAQPLQIVCGAPNARADLVTALATVGSQLPGEKHIGAAALRGVDSHGMLCSSRELGLSDDQGGIIELPSDAPPGLDLRKYLDLDDAVLDLSVPPNRGDAMSILGIAREVAAIAGTALKGSVATTTGSVPATPEQRAPAEVKNDSLHIKVEPKAGAPRLLVRRIRGVDNTRPSPLWLRERLRRAGLRSISPLVDITNYVMLELGQPLHAYDKAHLHGGLTARRARSGDQLTLLDGREVILDPDVLVIADDRGPVGLAGVMGGKATAISAQTTDVVLEAAWFKPEVIAGRARRFGLFTDAAQRFERGVDWRGQTRALALAKRLVLDIAGGASDKVVTCELPDELPVSWNVSLRYRQLERLLGISVAPSHVEQYLKGLGLDVTANADGWNVLPPSWRFDISIEADLIEEVGRIGGLDLIDEQMPTMAIGPRAMPSSLADERAILRTLAARGYQEIITFGFVDPALQKTLFANEVGRDQTIELINPISTDLAVMRSSLWPGLISVAKTNLQRQQPRVRVFEVATRFARAGDGYQETKSLAGLSLGSRLPEQWGAKSTDADFFDVKADLRAVLTLGAGAQASDFRYEPAALGCLHPGRSARVLRGVEEIGWIGELHPQLIRTLDFTYVPIVFEIDYLRAFGTKLAQFHEVSRFPQIRRDISVTVPDAVAFAALKERVSVVAGDLLQQISAFDLYQGKGVESGRKSIALGLILQDLSRTLTDEDADRVVSSVLSDLQVSLDARIRE
jgi:phenylalanyl-tRNA synthetase beta chain